MKTFLLKSWLLLACLLMGVGSMWGQTITPYYNNVKGSSFDITNSNKTSGTVVSSVLTYSAPDATYNSPQWRLAAGKSITFKTTSSYKIDKITMTFSSTGYTGTWSLSSGTPSVSGTDGTFSNINNSTVTMTTSTAARIKSVCVYYVDAGSSKTLSSISVSGNPNKVVYKAGDKFDPTGLVVTGTYDDNSTKTITSGITWSEPAALTAGQTSVDITATVSGITSTAYTVNGLTVNERLVVPGTYSIALNKTLYGVETGNYAVEQSTESDDITVVSGCLSDATSKTYYADAHIRYYVGSYLKLSVPTGFLITKVQFVEPSTDKKWDATATEGIDVNAGVYAPSSKSWAGLANKVDFSFSKQCRIGSITVTYVASATITLNAACHDSEGKVYGTYSNASAWVVPSELEVSEIGVTEGKLNVVSYNTGDVVPANTGVMVAAAEGGEYIVALSAEDGAHPDGVTNALHPSSETMAGENLFYRLTMHNGTQIGFWWGAENGAAFSLAANKAYLAVPKAAGQSLAPSFWFGNLEDETAIESVKAESTKEIYNLSGQRLQQMQKGINIVNGKKVLVK